MVRVLGLLLVQRVERKGMTLHAICDAPLPDQRLVLGCRDQPAEG